MCRARACAQFRRGTGDPGGGGGCGRVRLGSRTRPVDGCDPIVPGRSRVETGVRIRGRGRSGVLGEYRPGVIVGVRGPDPVSRDRGPAVVGGRRPGQVDPLRAHRGGLKVRWRIRTGSFRRRAGDVGWRAHTHGVDRRYSIVPGIRAAQTCVGVRRGCRARLWRQVGPLSIPTLGHFDPVAGDGGAAIVGRRLPREIDLGLSNRGGHKPGGCCGYGGGGGCRCDIGWRARARGADRGNAVVSRTGGSKTGLRKRGSGRVCVFPEIGPAVSAGRYFDPVAGYRAIARVRRRRPLQIDGILPVSHGSEIGGCSGHPGILRGSAGDIRRQAGTAGVDRRDPVVTLRAGLQSRVPIGGLG